MPREQERNSSQLTARQNALHVWLILKLTWQAKKQGSIGKAEPNGQLSIIDNNGVEPFAGEATGELVYRGENVTMGYAVCKEDLVKGDENHGIMHTGDIAYRDADGYYFIVGRMKRFLKIFWSENWS